MMGTDPFLWIGIADPYPDPNHPFITDPLPIPIRIGSQINDSDPAHHCIYIYIYIFNLDLLLLNIKLLVLPINS